MDAIQVCFQRKIRLSALPAASAAELLARSATLEANRQQYQWCMPHVSGVSGVNPLEQTKSKVEDIYPLLFLERAGIMIKIE